MCALCGDYGDPMRRHFRDWLRDEYHNDLSAFRAAWNKPTIHFESAEVPSAEAQLPAKRYTFRDPLAEQNVVDYFRCLAELCADCVIDFCRANSLRETMALLKHNMAQDLTHGQGVWWASWKVDPLKEPVFAPLIKGFQELGTFALDLDLGPSADIAVLVDDESFFYESCAYHLDIPLIFQQRLWGLPKMGAPFDLYLLQDFVEGKLKTYKLYIFLNAFRLDERRREAIKRHVRQGNRAALWVYAPGYINKDSSLKNIEELTGFRMGRGEQPWGPLVHITDFAHPITAGLPQDLVWGTNNKLAPLFYVDDPQAKILGQVVYSQGNCKPGFAVKTYPEWISIYCAAPNIPASVLRNIARFAGAHIYNEEGDVLYATPQLLGVHTVSGGRRRFKLPLPVDEVYDLFEQKTIAANVGAFQVDLTPMSSALYYTGASAVLSSLRRPSRA